MLFEDMSQLNSALDGIQNNYNTTKAYSSVYSDGTNHYLVEGHHITAVFKVLGKWISPKVISLMEINLETLGQNLSSWYT